MIVVDPKGTRAERAAPRVLDARPRLAVLLVVDRRQRSRRAVLLLPERQQVESAARRQLADPIGIEGDAVADDERLCRGDDAVVASRLALGRRGGGSEGWIQGWGEATPNEYVRYVRCVRCVRCVLHAVSSH